MKKLALAIIMAMLGTFSYAAGNEIYIDQVGDGDTINITQTGSTNKVGSSTTDAVINGGGNTVTIDQVGNNNEVVMSVGTTSGGATVTTSATGDYNSQTVACPDCSGSTITSSITGDNNTTSQTLNGGGGKTSNITITGDYT